LFLTNEKASIDAQSTYEGFNAKQKSLLLNPQFPMLSLEGFLRWCLNPLDTKVVHLLLNTDKLFCQAFFLKNLIFNC
jgi:hypothetical protein